MTLDAIAALPIQLDVLRDHLRIEHEDHGQVLFRSTGRTLAASPLDDGVKIGLDVAFSTAAETLGEIVLRDLGPCLGELERVFVYPSVARPSATSYEGLVEEIGEGGEWIALPSQSAGLDLGAGPDMMAQMQTLMQTLMQNPDAMTQLASMAQGLLANEGMRAQLEGLAAGMQGQAPGDLLGAAAELAEKLSRSQPELTKAIESAMSGLDSPEED